MALAFAKKTEERIIMIRSKQKQSERRIINKKDEQIIWNSKEQIINAEEEIINNKEESIIRTKRKKTEEEAYDEEWSRLG